MNGQVYKRNQDIVTKLREAMLKGHSARSVYLANLHLAAMPASETSFYRVYRDDIEQAKFEYNERLLNLAHNRMEEGSDKLIELALRSKLGWNPTTKVQEVDAEDTDEHSDPVSILMEKLGKSKVDEEGIGNG